MNRSPLVRNVGIRLVLPVLVLAGRAAPAADLNEKDRAMVARLEAIRLGKAEVKNGRFDLEQADRAYAAAFRGYGLDVEKLAPKRAAAAVKGKAIRVELAAALDDWAILKTAGAGRQRLLALARAIDPDPWRNRLRETLEKVDAKALKRLAADAELKKQPPSTVVLLADALAAAGARDEAVAVLRQAQRLHPDDFWINLQLGTYLMPRQSQEAARYFRAALALHPKNASTHNNLGIALQIQGRLDEAVAAYRQALRLEPDLVMAWMNLGRALAAQGKVEEATACCRKVIALDPRLAPAHLQLGDMLMTKGQADEAVTSYRKAITLDPKLAPAHRQLGAALMKQGRLQEALACYRKALALDPKDAQARKLLDDALRVKGGAK